MEQPLLISNLMHKILIYLHIRVIHLLKSSTCFEHYPDHLQEVCVVIVYMQSLVSSLSAGDCPVHRLRKNWSDEWDYWLDVKLVVNMKINKNFMHQVGDQPRLYYGGRSTHQDIPIQLYRCDGSWYTVSWKQITYLTKVSTVIWLIPRYCVLRSITFIQGLHKKKVNSNNLTLLHHVSYVQKWLIWCYTVLLWIDSLMMHLCGQEHVGIFIVIM
jgi:hypothetical protein